MKNEKWKPIMGFDGYEVSFYGSVRSIDRVISYPNYHKQIKGCIIQQRKDSLGRYKLVDLRKNKKHYTCLVHRLVYEAFCGKLNNLEVNHINGICDDNRADNLEAVTHSQNEKHKYDKLGCKGVSLGKKGQLHGRSKKVAQIDVESGQVIKVYGSVREAERITGTHSSCIVLCCKGEQCSSNGYKWSYFGF